MLIRRESIKDDQDIPQSQEILSVNETAIVEESNYIRIFKSGRGKVIVINAQNFRLD